MIHKLYNNIYLKNLQKYANLITIYSILYLSNMLKPQFNLQTIHIICTIIYSNMYITNKFENKLHSIKYINN